MKRVLSSSLICLVLALCGSVASADDAASSSSSATSAGKHHHPPKPPKEAFTACANLVENDACTVTTPRGDVIDGTCAPAPGMEASASSGTSTQSTTSIQSTALACRPAHMPPPPQQGSEPAEGMPSDAGAEE